LILSAPESNALDKDDENLFQIVGHQIANILTNVELVRNIKKLYDKQEEALKKLKTAAKKLSDYTKDLEKVIEKRTSEMVQSEKLASIGQLVSGVAHELNNPLTIVVGLIDPMVESKDWPAHQKKRLNKVHDATMRCAKVVENLIKFSRKGVLHKETININSIVEETIGFFE
jgi:C4-dicarboxylate-specific signal transduction histidine kinase